MARRKDHSREELKTLIIDTAWDIMGREGLNALTARRIGSEIGYAAGTLYNIFPSMDHIILELNGKTLDLLYDVLSDKKNRNISKTPDENMVSMAQSYIKFSNSYHSYWMALFCHDIQPEAHQEEWYQKKLQNIFMPLQSLLKQRFPDIDSDQCMKHSRILWASVHGIHFLHKTGKLPYPDGKKDINSIIKSLISTYLRGINSRV